MFLDRRTKIVSLAEWQEWWEEMRKGALMSWQVHYCTNGTQEPEQSLAFCFFLGQVSSRMGQLILYLSSMHSKTALLLIEATWLGILSDTKII